MSRTAKKGISFYRMDTGHIRNRKVRLLFNEFGSDGYWIWKCLLDTGYGNWGYYFDLNDKDALELFATEDCKKTLSLVKEVIAGCLRRGLFNKAVYELSGVLTCYNMQEVFIYATYDRRKKGTEFEMVSDWLLINLGDFNTTGIKLIPGKNPIPPGKNTQTETKTETKTEILTPASPPSPSTGLVEKKGRKKKNDDPEPYWSALVAVWFDFIKEKFGDEPSFQRDDPRILKRIIGLLKNRAAIKKIEWTGLVAQERFRAFLDKAFLDPWLCTNFLLSNLEKQFDKIILNNLRNGNQNGTTRKDFTHRAVITGTAESAGTL